MGALEQKLEKARKLYRDGDFRNAIFADLTRANYQPAKVLLREMLDDVDEAVRSITLDRLYRMVDLSKDTTILEKARSILLKDRDESCRATAAMILGTHSKWPDAALVRALDRERDLVTREAIFLAVLECMVSWDFADKHRSGVRDGSTELSLANARKLAGSASSKRKTKKKTKKKTKTVVSRKKR